MLEPMEGSDAKEFWEYFLANEERFKIEQFTEIHKCLDCFRAGMECQKKKLIVRKTL